MRTFRLLVVRRLRRAPLRAATTVLAIAAGVSLAVSISVLLSSIDRSLEEFGQGLAGPAPLRIAGATLRGGLPEDAVERARLVDGVAEVVPMIQTVSRTQPAAGGPLSPALVLGVDCRIEALVGPIGCDPATLAEAQVPMALGPGQGGGAGDQLRTDTGVLALGDAPVLDSLAFGDGRSVVLPLPLAQDVFTRPGQLDVAYVLVADGADVGAVQRAVQDAVGDHLPVLAAAEPPAGASGVLGAALPIYSLLGIFALGIGAVLVANTAAMSLEARRRELAVLGALGGRARTVVGTTVAEMGLLGATGGILGSAGGVLVARPIVASISTFTEDVVGAPLSTHVPPSVLLLGAGLGAALGAGAALLPARRATRLDVAAELSGREAADTARPVRLGRRALVWSLATGLGTLGCWAAQREGGLEPSQAALVTPAFLLATVGSLFGAAALAPLLVGRLVPLATRTTSAPVRLALAAARRDHRRTGVLAVAVSAAVVTAFVTEGSSASARASIKASFERGGEGVDVATIPADEGSGPNVTPDLRERLVGFPGAAELNEGTFVVAGASGDQVLVHAASGNRLTIDVLDGTADPERLADGEVLIGAGLARHQGIRAGDEVRVTTPGGEVELPVQGVWEDGNLVGANVTMSPALLTELYGPQPPAFVALRPAPGVSEAELGRRLEEAGLHPELVTRTSSQVADDIADQVDAQFASFRVMQQALLVVLFAAVLSSLLLAAVQRRRELGLLAAVGAEPPALARMLLLEAGGVAVVGLVISVGVGPLMMFCLNQVLPFVVGFRNPLAFEWAVLVVSGAIAVVVALVGAAWPARRAARVEVLDALRYE